MEKDAENYSNINLFSSKINICSNKPITTIQKFRCTVTNLNTADEVTRIDGSEVRLYKGARTASPPQSAASHSTGNISVGV